jgi:Flp pilus assembly protein TadG
MKSLPLSFLRSQSGAAGAEMALVTPLLLVIMFGAFELGNYFYSEHVVSKGVRDGARFASRALPLNVLCASGSFPSSVVDNTKAITRTGQVSGGAERLAGWTDNATVQVLPLPKTSGAFVGSGIYNGRPTDVCVIQVKATVPYNSLFAILGLTDGDTLTLNAASEAPVVGI